MIKMTDAHPRVPGRGGVRSIARSDLFIGGHLARGGKLHRRGEIAAGGLENRFESVEDCRQADFRMTIAGGDRGLIELRAGKKSAIDFRGEFPDILMVGRAERV